MDGCRKINLLIGPPNVGKSNILEALSLFHYLKTDFYASLPELVRVKNFSELFYNWDIKNPGSIIIDGELALKLKYLSESNVQAKFETLIQIVNDNWVSEPNMELQSLNLFYNENLLNKVARNDFSTPNFLFYKYKDYDFETLNSAEGMRLDIPFGKNLFNLIKLNKELRKEVIELVRIYGLQLGIEKGIEEIKFLKIFEDGTMVSYPYHLLADTLKRLIFHKAAILTNASSIILFEEPEAHCYEPYILEITNLIKHDEYYNQFFIVTHSSFVIQELLRDSEVRKFVSVFLVGSENMETKIKRMEDELVYEVYNSGLDVFFNYESLWKDAAVV
jgi:AAA15 family ATPase/GTPase